MTTVKFESILQGKIRTYLEGGLPHMIIPYTPSAGKMPNYLAGRDKTIKDGVDVIMANIEGGYAQPIVFYGLRGVGKTVLLNRIENEVEDNQQVICYHIEAKESKEESSFKTDMIDAIQTISHEMSVVEAFKTHSKRIFDAVRSFQLKWSPADESFTVGMDNSEFLVIANTGTYSTDLITLWKELGKLAVKCDKQICFLIDEIQYLQKDELNALIMAMHRINQLDLPITMIGAGLPKVLAEVGDAKSYSERLYYFYPIGALSYEDTKQALIQPAEKNNVYYDEDAIKKIFKITHGYPYFIQEYGACIWNYITDQEKIVTLDMVNKAYPIFIQKLDNSFFKMRYDRAKPAERKFLFAMAERESLPCGIGEIAEILELKQQSISPTRGNLINKGLIHSTGHGELDFSVPLFKDYLFRIKQRI